MIEAFQEYIAHHRLCQKQEKILVAVSGGVDSAVMLHLLLNSGYTLAVAHVNFQLRGKESDGDEHFVREIATQYGIPIFVKSFNTRAFAAKQKISIEMAARQLRYDYFAGLLEKYHFQKLAVGHNKDDDAETFFIKLMRGSGLDGLKGMLAKRENIIRPLLFARRKEILAYAQKNKLSFREDSSNNTDDYRRNRIRHHLLPYYEKEFPGAKKALADTLEKLKSTETIFRQLLQEKKKQLFIETKNDFRLSKTVLQTLEPKEVWLYFLLEEFGFHQDIVRKILKAMESEQSGQLFYSPGFILLNDRSHLIIRKSTLPDEEVVLIHNLNISISKPLNLSFKTFPPQPDFNLYANKMMVYFDADKLSLPLKIRHWQKGDRFVPFGMRGSKLVSDFFTDEKINRFERENCWLLLCGNEIIWIIGHRASNRFRVSHKTKEILQISLLPVEES